MVVAIAALVTFRPVAVGAETIGGALLKTYLGREGPSRAPPSVRLDHRKISILTYQGGIEYTTNLQAEDPFSQREPKVEISGGTLQGRRNRSASGKLS
jgi:hypothetical protein